MLIRILILVLFGLLCAHSSLQQGRLATRTTEKRDENPIIWMLIRQVDRLATQITKLQDKNDDIGKQLTKLKIQFNDLGTKIDGEQKTPNIKTKELIAKDNKMTDKINVQEKEISRLQNTLSEIKTTQDEIYKEQRAMSTEITKHDNNVKDLQTSISTFGDLVRSCVKKSLFEVLNVKVGKLEDLVSKREQKISDIDKKLSDVNILATRVTKLEDTTADVKKILKDIKSNEKRVNCKSDWKLYGHHCYYFGNNKVTWDSAKNYCERQNSHLVKIEDSKENSWLGSQVKSSIYYVWIGAIDKEKEGTWMWYDKTLFTYSNWNKKAGEPNDAGRNEDCGVLLNVDGFVWADGNCGMKFVYICETL